ncbi:MAG: aldehyde dehydrogenase family protein [Thermomicrobiales bacterium]
MLQTQVGPVISDEAANRILGDIESAEREGARLLAGGMRLSSDGRERGNFVAPTLFRRHESGLDSVRKRCSDPCWASPLFRTWTSPGGRKRGPLRVVTPIFTRDLGKAMKFINGIEAGIVHVNAETPGAEPHVPFGGYKVPVLLA